MAYFLAVKVRPKWRVTLLVLVNWNPEVELLFSKKFGE